MKIGSDRRPPLHHVAPPPVAGAVEGADLEEDSGRREQGEQQSQEATKAVAHVGNTLLL